MKHIIAIVLLVLTASLNATEVVVYSNPSDSPIRVAGTVSSTNELTRLGETSTFPSSFSGHRSVCTVGSTNAPFVAWSGGEAYSVGDPYGCSTGRDDAAIELTDVSEITPRINLYTGASDRPYTYHELYSDITQRVYNLNLSNLALSNTLARLRLTESNRIKEPSFKSGDNVRVRVVRWLIDDTPCWRVIVTNRVVVEKHVIMNQSSVLTEADIITPSEPDIDWNTYINEVVNNIYVRDECLTCRNAYYLVVFGDGEISWSGATDSNKVVCALSNVIHRDFGPSAPETKAVPFSSGVSLARPTFRFKYAGLDLRSYPAFEMQIMSGGSTVWSSGAKRTPPRDRSGNYVYSAPPLTGTLSPGSYTWKVRLLNSRYRDSPWSQPSPVTFE